MQIDLLKPYVKNAKRHDTKQVKQIAAEKTNRTCYMMELDPKYVDVIIKRWEDYTGLKAEKSDG